MGIFNKLFGGGDEPNPDNEVSNERFAAHYNSKQQALEGVLGISAAVVGHAVIPFGIIGGITIGSVDMHYFPNHIPGTGLTTMELIKPDGKGPKPNKKGTYELVAFTRQPFNDINQDPPAPFNIIERRICDTFTQIAGAARDKAFNPYEICMLKGDDGRNKYILFDVYKEFKIGSSKHHLLLCIEIFEEELVTVGNFGHKGFVEMLKMIKIYPYSDLDRNWVGVKK